MITLKEMLAEPQTMYDGGMVQHMAEGGEPDEELKKLEDKAIDLRQRAENIPDIIERPSPSTVTEQQLPVTTKPTLPVPKSLESKLPKIVGTILKARKYTNPLGLAAQVLNLIPPKAQAAAVDYLKNTPAHELFGLEKSGQEYVGDLWEEVKNNLTTETDEASPKKYDLTETQLGKIHKFVTEPDNAQRELAKSKGFGQQLVHVTKNPEIVEDILRIIPTEGKGGVSGVSDIGIHMVSQEDAPHVYDAFLARQGETKDPDIGRYRVLEEYEKKYQEILKRLQADTKFKSIAPARTKEDMEAISELNLVSEKLLDKYQLENKDELDNFVNEYMKNPENILLPEGMNTIPIQANINKYLKVPDMLSFKNPEQWIRKMSYTTDGGRFFNEELFDEVYSSFHDEGSEVDIDTIMDEYAAAQETQYPESVIELYPDDPEYDEKIFMNIRPESMPDVHIEGESVIPFEAKVKLWKDITRGALKFSDLPENQKRNEQWVEFLRNILDKTGADAYGYENEAEGGGEISFMALHPEKAKSLFSEGFDPTKQEMGKYRGGQIRPMYDGGMVQHMAEGGEPKGIRDLLIDTAASNPANITPNQKTMRTSDNEPVSLSLEQLQDIPGASGEEKFRADPEAFGGVGKYGPLRESIKRKGYQDYEGNPLTTDPITLHINSKGKAVIVEGNHRLAEALESGRDSIPVHIQYYGGSENIKGPYNPDRLQLGTHVLKGEEKGAIRLSPEEFNYLTKELPVTEPQPLLDTPPVPKSLERSLPKVIEKVSKGFLRKIPVIQIAYNLYNILPKRFGQLPDILEYLKDTQTHELFGLDKSGQEYLQDILNKIFSKKISVEDINELDFYHATTATDLEGGALRASTEGSLDRGLYISPDPNYAAMRGIKGEALGGNIHPVKVNIKNPLIIRFNKTDSSIQGKLLEVLDITQGKENPVDTAINKGYDSIFVVDEETNEIIEASIFDENNVSSKFKPMYDGGLV